MTKKNQVKNKIEVSEAALKKVKGGRGLRPQTIIRGVGGMTGSKRPNGK
jgi:hypothetical protein